MSPDIVFGPRDIGLVSLDALVEELERRTEALVVIYEWKDRERRRFTYHRAGGRSRALGMAARFTAAELRAEAEAEGDD